MMIMVVDATVVVVVAFDIGVVDDIFFATVVVDAAVDVDGDATAVVISVEEVDALVVEVVASVAGGYS